MELNQLIAQRLVRHKMQESAPYKSGDRYYGGLPAEPSASEYGRALDLGKKELCTFDMDAMTSDEFGEDELATGIKVEDLPRSSNRMPPTVRITGTRRQFLQWSRVAGVDYSDIRPYLKPVESKSKPEIKFVIKNRRGDILSAPTTDEDALWDRVTRMENRGQRGLSVVVYTGETTRESRRIPRGVQPEYSDGSKIITRHPFKINWKDSDTKKRHTSTYWAGTPDDAEKAFRGDQRESGWKDTDYEIISVKQLESRREDEAYRDDYVKVANSTSRSGGASAINKDGSIRSVTARYVMDHANKDDAILDFGAGKTAVQAQALKDKGFTNVTAYDFGANSKEGLHDPKALSRTYDIVFASNVINVSSDEEMLRDTLKDMWKAVKSGGRCIFNYPASPRKAGFSAQEVQDIVEDELGKTPKIVVGPKSSPVYELVK